MQTSVCRNKYSKQFSEMFSSPQPKNAVCRRTLNSMANSSRSINFRPKPFIFCLLVLPPALLLLSLTFRPAYFLESSVLNRHKWLLIASKELNGRRPKIGFVNVGDGEFGEIQSGLKDKVYVPFDRVSGDIRWVDLFPEWIDEDRKWSAPRCPEIPMPSLGSFRDLDIVVARLPCAAAAAGEKEGRKGVRDVFQLQVNLVVANLTVESGMAHVEVERPVIVVFIGSCRPMLEIFRCDDLVEHGEDYWVYRPDLRKLKQKLLMPVGSCQLAPPYSELGKERWRSFASSSRQASPNYTIKKSREAYATILHSSEDYVCGAIALAQSIAQTGSTKDLLLLVDSSITPPSLHGLRAAGWKIKQIERIRNPNAEKDAYNEWNYSKLRLWQLTEYDKIIFIDADLIVLKNMDSFFVYPQLSGAGNDQVLFNSGIMVVEPSKCLFECLMEKTWTVESYNGGDQGFLNEVFTWWHRCPRRLNFLKMFEEGGEREIPANVYAIHYLGLKPWMCYRDYDCNWDMADHHIFASDSAHRRWWEVYDRMPEQLWGYCGLNKKKDTRIRKWRRIAQKANLSDGHWKTTVRDLRQSMLIDLYDL